MSILLIDTTVLFDAERNEADFDVISDNDDAAIAAITAAQSPRPNYSSAFSSPRPDSAPPARHPSRRSWRSSPPVCPPVRGGIGLRGHLIPPEVAGSRGRPTKAARSVNGDVRCGRRTHPTPPGCHRRPRHGYEPGRPDPDGIEMLDGAIRCRCGRSEFDLHACTRDHRLTRQQIGEAPGGRVASRCDQRDPVGTCDATCNCWGAATGPNGTGSSTATATASPSIATSRDLNRCTT